MFVKPEPKYNKEQKADCTSFCPTCTKPHVTCRKSIKPICVFKRFNRCLCSIVFCQYSELSYATYLPKLRIENKRSIHKISFQTA